MVKVKNLLLPMRIKKVKSLNKRALMKQFNPIGKYDHRKQWLVAKSKIRVRIRKRTFVLKCKVYFDGVGMYWIFGYINKYRVYGTRDDTLARARKTMRECVATVNELTWAWANNGEIAFNDSWGKIQQFGAEGYKSFGAALKHQVELGDVGFY